MAFVGCSSEEAAHFVGREVGDHVGARLEIESDAFDMVGLHYAEHYLFIDGEGHVYLRSLHHCGPVLVADGVAELHRYAHDVERVFAFKAAEVDHEHIAEVEAQDRHVVVLWVEVYDVAVGYARSALQGDGVFMAMVGGDEETALLGRPLVDEDSLHVHALDFLGPFGLVYVADDFGDYIHLFWFIWFKHKECGNCDSAVPADQCDLCRSLS